MHKIAVLLFSVCVLFTGCSSSSIGIIGGADGPTQVYVSSDGAQENKENTGQGVRMVKVNGELYYDAGKESETEARCGVMDGQITAETELPKIPAEENTSNFGTEFGYQLGTEDTIEIPVDGKWYLFRKLSADRDISYYKYCVALKGTLPNAERQSSCIVLTNDRNLTFEKASKSIYSSSTADQLDLYFVSME